MAFLELQNIRKGFSSDGQWKVILQEVTLQIDKGEFVAIVGFSGAGKTTLVSVLAGLALPDSGSVQMDGYPVTGPSIQRALVFQNYSLLPWMSVFENVQLAVEAASPELTVSERRARSEHYVRLVGLEQARDRRPARLSGGMRQRVSVARALAMQPKVLLLDEPLSALDALTRSTMQIEFKRLCAAEGKTVVLITNDVDEALLLADRVIPLSCGPAATLGPAWRGFAREESVSISGEFKNRRMEIVNWLMTSRRLRATSELGQGLTRAAAVAFHPLEKQLI